MPTILIETNALSAPEQRRIAVQLTRWFADHGIRPDRVVVRFTVADLNLAFSGGLPVVAMRHPDAVCDAAWVTCCISPDRDDEFRSGLADRIAELLQVTRHTALFYVEFRPTDPRQVYLAGRSPLHRADTRMEPHRDIEGEEG